MEVLAILKNKLLRVKSIQIFLILKEAYFLVLDSLTSRIKAIYFIYIVETSFKSNKMSKFQFEVAVEQHFPGIKMPVKEGVKR